MSPQEQARERTKDLLETVGYVDLAAKEHIDNLLQTAYIRGQIDVKCEEIKHRQEFARRESNPEYGEWVEGATE